MTIEERIEGLPVLPGISCHLELIKCWQELNLSHSAKNHCFKEFNDVEICTTSSQMETLKNPRQWTPTSHHQSNGKFLINSEWPSISMCLLAFKLGFCQMYHSQEWIELMSQLFHWSPWHSKDDDEFNIQKCPISIHVHCLEVSSNPPMYIWVLCPFFNHQQVKNHSWNHIDKKPTCLWPPALHGIGMWKQAMVAHKRVTPWWLMFLLSCSNLTRGMHTSSKSFLPCQH